MLLAGIFHFTLGFRWLQTFNDLKVRGLGRPGKHSGHIYWVMYAVTSRAVRGVQLLFNEMKVIQNIPIRQQVAGNDFYVVLCSIPCSVNPHQPRSVTWKMSPKFLPPLDRPYAAPVVTQQSSPCRCHTYCLPSSRWCMKQCLLIIFDTEHFGTWKWVIVSLRGFALNVILILTVCDCHHIALVAFWRGGWI